jgi:hypothetical protein
MLLSDLIGVSAADGRRHGLRTGAVSVEAQVPVNAARARATQPRALTSTRDGESLKRRGRHIRWRPT